MKDTCTGELDTLCRLLPRLTWNKLLCSKHMKLDITERTATIPTQNDPGTQALMSFGP